MKWWQLPICALLVAGSMLVDVDVPTPATRYNVVSVQDELTLYLAFSGTGQKYSVVWVVSEDQAWRYFDRVSAQADADRFGGTPVPVRGE